MVLYHSSFIGGVLMKTLVSRCFEVNEYFSREYYFHRPLSLSLCASHLGLSVQYVSYIVASSEFEFYFPVIRRHIYDDIRRRKQAQCSDMRRRKQGGV